MNSEIKPGSRVRVTRIVNGYDWGYYMGTVMAWTGQGRLKIKTDTGELKTVSPDNVKLIR